MGWHPYRQTSMFPDIPPGRPIDGSPLTSDSLVVSYTPFALDHGSLLSFLPLFLLIEIKNLKRLVISKLSPRR